MACVRVCLNQVKFLLKLLIIYIFITVCILPFLKHNFKFSKVYQHDIDTEFENAINVNYQRRLSAKRYLQSLKAAKVKQSYIEREKSGHFRYTICVITVARNTHDLNEPQQTEYLTQVMSRLHEILNKSRALDEVFLFMCNVDPSPDQYEEATRMERYFPSIKRYEDKHIKWKNRHILEKQDYAFCLESALKYNSKYVLILQDDAYPHDNFYQIMDDTLRTKLEYRIRMGELVPDTGDWAWLKLTVPYYKNDFHSDIFNIYQWIALTLFFTGSITLFYYLYQECTFRTSSNGRLASKNKMAPYWIFLVSFPCIFAITWTLGRPYYLKARSLSSHFYYLEPGTSCCLPAVVYPRDKIPGIVKFITQDVSLDEGKYGGSNRHVKPLDWALDDYREEYQLRQFLLTPNVFTHIGLYSTLNRRFYKDKSFAYEYFQDN